MGKAKWVVEMNSKSESNGRSPRGPNRWIWDRPSGLLPGEDPPSLEDEVAYLEIVVAEASQAIEQAQGPQEKEKYRLYLKRAIERHNKAAKRLAALEMEVEYA